jgi:hypothetical protein
VDHRHRAAAADDRRGVEAAAFLYEPAPVVRWHSEPSRGTGGGAQRFVGENPAAALCSATR